jgi:2'-5' RNA ligase
MPAVGDTALVLLVPEADAIVDRWRADHDLSAARSVSAHITVLIPFAPEGAIDEKVHADISSLCRVRRPLIVTFSTFGRFPSVLWLDPASPACFDLLRDVRERWPEFPPYGRADLEVVPHLTVAHGPEDALLDRAAEDIASHLPLTVELRAMSLLAFDGAVWTRRRQYTFGG